MAPKKNIKMDLSSFLADDTFGGPADSWADEFDPSMLSNTSSVAIDIGFEPTRNEPVIPEEPPYTIRIASFPEETNEDDLRYFFIDGLKLENPDEVIEDFYVPKEMDGRLKSFAFITFITRELLIEALALNDQPIHGKPVYVSVAKPSKNKRERRSNQDWSGARGARSGNRYEEDSSLDWSGARGARSQFEPRNDFGGRERRGPPRDDNMDWGSARGSGIIPNREGGDRPFRGAPRERREFPKEDNMDWGAARGSRTIPTREGEERQFKREPRERREHKPVEDSFDWGAARGSKTVPIRETEEKPFRKESREPREHKPIDDTFDWGAARGSKVQPERERKNFKPKTDNLDWNLKGSMLKNEESKSKSSSSEKTEKTLDGPKKSMFSVLQSEEDDDEEEEEKSSSKEDESDKIVKATETLSLADEDGWEKA